ncbi:MAG: type I-U CRISPR-associated protein Csb2 [Syntrophaceae bacterium]
MVVLELRFLTGRFHATPWGRNVNEGVPEWPPSPYRLARTLIDLWKRRFPDWPASRILPLLNLFSRQASFTIPDATVGHTRSYLSSNEKDPEKKQLVFDAFVVTGKDNPVHIGFEGDLSKDELFTLQQLFDELNYFGRSETWVTVNVMDHESMRWNCTPNGTGAAGRIEKVACLTPFETYQQLKNKPIKKIARRKQARTDMDWIGAISMTTEDLLRDGWSDPPALQWVNYTVPDFKVPKIKSVIRRRLFSYAKYALSSTVLPRIEETVSFAERIRTKLMGIHRRIQKGDPTLVSNLFSGKDIYGSPIKGHQHVFFLPLDEDGDGRLDHLLIKSGQPFNNSELAALDSLRSIWQPDGKPDVNLVLISLLSDPPINSTRVWVSATPFVTSRHYRKGRGSYVEWLEKEICHECTFHGIPHPTSISWIPHSATNPPVRWLRFQRSRKGQPPMRGYGCVLTFNEPVNGPFVIGSLSHFGLGLFVANSMLT